MSMFSEQANRRVALWSLGPLAERTISDLGEGLARHEARPATDYESIFEALLEEYDSYVDAGVLRLLARKAVDIYAATAPAADRAEANALCRLSLEWWLINSVLDHKYAISLSHEACRRLLLENAMMFHEARFVRPDAARDLDPLQRGFNAVARLCWQRAGASTVWMTQIASELRRYIFSRNIGLRGRMDSFDTIDEVIRVRRDDGGMIAQVLLTEIGSRDLPQLSDDTRRAPAFTEALERLSTLAALLNDIASISLDRRSGALNSVLFVYERSQPPMNERDAMLLALDETCGLVEQEHSSFMRALRELESLDTDSPEILGQYKDYLRTFLRGYWKWQLSCPSYFEEEHPVMEFRLFSESMKRISTR